jgi:hypothetical protein
VIQRIREMKAEYERQINELIKEKAMENIKVETLV